MTKYDAIVIGAGHNGLIAASYLAKAGHSVIVLDGRASPGGCASSKTHRRGIHRFRLCAVDHSAGSKDREAI